MGRGWHVVGGSMRSGQWRMGWEVVAVTCRAVPGSLQVYF